MFGFQGEGGKVSLTKAKKTHWLAGGGEDGGGVKETCGRPLSKAKGFYLLVMYEHYPWAENSVGKSRSYKQEKSQFTVRTWKLTDQKWAQLILGEKARYAKKIKKKKQRGGLGGGGEKSKKG